MSVAKLKLPTEECVFSPSHTIMKMACETRRGYNKLMDLRSCAQACPSVIIRVLRDLLLPQLTSRVTQKLVSPS